MVNQEKSFGKRGLLAATASVGAFLLPFLADAQGLVINEFSNGPSGLKEYVELVVEGTPCTTVDLRGWIIDDNNGDFACGPRSGVGIAQGHIKLDSVAAWSAVPVGAIILIHNDGDLHPLVPANDPTDSNVDSVWVIPVTSTLFRRATGPTTCPYNAGDLQPVACDAACPAATSSSAYLPSTYTGGGNNAQISVANGGDAIQTRRPDGTYYHGISYGNADMTGGPDGLKVSTTTTGSGKVWSLSDGNARTVGSWTQGTDDGVAGGAETPGAPNTVANNTYIEALLGDCGVLGPLAVSMEAWRTPSSVRIEGLAIGNPAPVRILIERIVTQGDAFATVADLPLPEGETTAFQWTDHSAPDGGTCLYRARAVMPDGRHVLSPIAEVKTFAQLQGGIAVFPNPAAAQVTCQFETEGEGAFTVMDIQGRLLHHTGSQHFTGFSEVTFSVQDWAPGVYAWQLTVHGQHHTGRLVVH